MFFILMLINWNIAIVLYISGARGDKPLLRQLEKRGKKKSISKSEADYKSRTFQRPQMKMSRRKPSAKDMLVLNNQNVKLLITERWFLSLSVFGFVFVFTKHQVQSIRWCSTIRELQYLKLQVDF